MIKPGTLWTGTSNIVVPGNKTSFPVAYQSRSRLHYYSVLFNSLEVNSSFYKVPQRKTFEKWAADVQGDFQFTVKLWKGITHGKGLVYDPVDIDRFMHNTAGLGEKKGCLLLQFPGSITSIYMKQVKRLITHVRKAEGGKFWRLAIEFRHTSWYTNEVLALLDKQRASLVLHDMPKSLCVEANDAAPFIFLRFHGQKGDYRGSYTKKFLRQKANEIRTWMKGGKDVYAYFNNTIGDAFENANALRGLVAGEYTGVRSKV